MTGIETRPLNGQDIGQTERATRAVLDQLLGETGTSFNQWVALNVLGTAGAAVQPDHLVRRMVDGLKVDASIGHATIEELRRLGLVDGHDQLELTDDGRHRFQGIGHGIVGISQRLYSDIPTDDLITARRVLSTVTERANAELAAGRRS